MSTSNNMLNILTLFSIEQPILDADEICEKLSFSIPTGYRYIKDLVNHGLLERLHGGQYTLGPQISVLDYISQRSNPVIHYSVPLMQDIAEQTEMDCCLTQLHEDYCLDIHHQSFKDSDLLAYGRGRPRPPYAGGAPKIMLAFSTSKTQKIFYEKYREQFSLTEFSQNEAEFLKKMSNIKKQGYYFSIGELESHLGAIAVPIVYSNKSNPIALSVVSSSKRLKLTNIDVIVDLLKSAAAEIENNMLGKKTE
ncbi:IclR family transcriptional regulator [Acinetobacter stercoris]|uniref:Pca operon regulatory protein n=1 Tax=Acinetobacter stercoris TaxID=2126983 RepID=A0A2U3MZL9_9GAMM|nr:IclR family transcriptional regulator C-terminal domain-containing protein [Acinetobacter stercoris]SPL70739.1 Pca operon regulatory protein [Acinetobacter stercoris]